MGHSTRTLDELVELLALNHVELLIDVRAAPGSRRMPHFAKAALGVSLPERGIAYEHMPELGGHRPARPDSINTGWRNEGFRGYADYMQEDAFRAALDTLEQKARERPTAIMCAEAVPWRCHRSLISDALTVRGVEVRHITGRSYPSLHVVTPFARVDNGRISYPAADTFPI
ncbi:MAG TPA: DUF488 domain-containing protein [Candidatus Nitrosopolaris sp.]|nr:DUF488 domain-containing protein [Candidatus Nitrosopolaris sp.]